MNKITADDLEGLNHKQQVMFALFCAKQVEHLTTSEEAKRCVEIIELWLEGKATAEECREATYAANAAGAAYAATYADWAADDAAWAADADVYATSAAIRAADAGGNEEEILKQQHQYLHELKSIDKILEQELLS